MIALNIIAIIALCLGGYISLMNWISFFYNIKQKNEKFHSPVPLGSLFLGIGLVCFKVTNGYLFILTIPADIGTVSLIIAIPKLLKEAWRTSHFCRLKTFRAKTGVAVYELNLYKYNNFILNINYDPPQIANEHGAKIISSGMRGIWNESDGVVTFAEDYGKSFRLVLGIDKYHMEESSYPESKKFKYDCLNGIEFFLQ